MAMQRHISGTGQLADGQRNRADRDHQENDQCPHEISIRLMPTHNFHLLRLRVRKRRRLVSMGMKAASGQVDRDDQQNQNDESEKRVGTPAFVGLRTPFR